MLLIPSIISLESKASFEIFIPENGTVEEYKLNELFCYDKELKVEHYDAKCNAEAFMEEINQFCQMYCTERVSVDLPGAIYVLFIREVGEYL